MVQLKHRNLEQTYSKQPIYWLSEVVVAEKNPPNTRTHRFWDLCEAP